MKKKYPDAALLVIRLTVGGLLLLHGISKVQNGVGWMNGPLAEIGLPSFIAYGVYIGEVLAPILIIIGFRTRLAAIAVMINMFMAILLVQQKNFFILNSGGGWGVELEMFFFLCALALFLSGGGTYKIGKTYNAWD